MTDATGYKRPPVAVNSVVLCDGDLVFVERPGGGFTLASTAWLCALDRFFPAPNNSRIPAGLRHPDGAPRLLVVVEVSGARRTITAQLASVP